ncbi:hypothetical protein [Planktothrix agardhii]|nr:hypothetical protein [Planktothrix agardhii]
MGKIQGLKAEKEELQEEINLMKNQIDSTEKWKGLIYPEEE